MLTKFAYFVLILSGLGILLSAGEPILLRARAYYQFRRIGMDTAIDKIASAELRSAAPDLTLAFILSTLGIFAGFGLLRRREWARIGWLLLCGLWLVATIPALALSSGASAFLAPAFRFIVFSISFRILLKPEIRAQFSNDRAGPSRT